MASPIFNGIGDAFLSALGEVGEALYTPVTDPAFDVRAVFHDQFVELDLSGIPYTTPTPTAWIKTTDFPNAQSGDTIVLDGTTWEVRAAEPDGVAMTRLTLSKE